MVKISARVENSQGNHQVMMSTNDRSQSIVIPPGDSGYGSRANGAELLLLALATCYCNDLYREAAHRNMTIKSVEVEVKGDYDGVPGHPVENITYVASVSAGASKAEILDLMKHTDTVAEIQNSLRQATVVRLEAVNAVLA